MDNQLLEDTHQIIESLRSELLKMVPHWAAAQGPEAFFDFEQELQVTLNALQARIVKGVLESIHRDEAFVAACKMQALHDLDMHNSGPREVLVRTLSGNQIRIQTPYVVLNSMQDQNVADDKGRREGVGRYPVLRRLGIVRGTTPRFLSEINRQMADGPSGADAEERLASREIIIDETPMWYNVRDFACIALWQRQVAASNSNQIEVIEPVPLAGKRVVIGIDGGRLRIRVNKDTNNSGTPKSYIADSCEPKLFVIYTIDVKGNKDRKHELVYDGTIQSNDMLFSLLKMRLKQMGIEHAELLVIIGDGATWIWKGAGEIRACLDLEKIKTFEIVDFAHSVSKLTIPAKLGIEDYSKQRTWLAKARKLLKEGKIDRVVELLSEFDSSRDRDGEISRAINYFQNHQHRMQYPVFRQEGLPIGSGVIESAVRRIVNFRLKGTSTYWSPEKAEQVLYLRCQIKSGKWNHFFKSVLIKWANDMSTSLPKVLQVREQIRTQFLASHPPLHVDQSRSGVIMWARNLINSTNVIVIDTETTGLGDRDEVIQLAVVDLQGNIILRLLFKPNTSISNDASSVHGIRDIDVASAPSFIECYGLICNTLQNKNIIAYNAEFDRRMLLQTCRRYNLPDLENVIWHCAMEKYACFWGERRGKNKFRAYSLSAACTQQEIKIEKVHDAVEDCLLTLELFKVIAVADENE